MKKVYFGLFAVLFAFNAQAFDVAGSLNKVSAATNDAAQKVEAAKNSPKISCGPGATSFDNDRHPNPTITATYRIW